MTQSSPRVAFMGTPPFAAHVLQAMIDASYTIVAVYTQPPRAQGRGYKLTPSPVHNLATHYGIPVFHPESLRTEEAQHQWENLNLDVAVVAAYGLILPQPILDAPRKGCVNIHASLLPRWRGAAPIQRAILEGDPETGITLMKMDRGMDTGDILGKISVPLQEWTTTPLLLDHLARLGAKALIETLPHYLRGEIQLRPQPQEGVTYAQKLTKQEGLLDWTLSAIALERKVRGLNPWPGTWFTHRQDTIKVLEAIALPETAAQLPGTILDDQLTIACGEGTFRPLLVQKIGKAPLSTAEFLRGYDLSDGPL